jgi:hypothetical protein
MIRPKWEPSAVHRGRRLNAGRTACRLARPAGYLGRRGNFAFSGMDGPINVRSGFVATYAGQLFRLLIYTPRRRMLDVIVPEPAVTRLATGDVSAASAPRGDLLVTFSAWHNLVGIAPPATASAWTSRTVQKRSGAILSG